MNSVKAFCWKVCICFVISFTVLLNQISNHFSFNLNETAIHFFDNKYTVMFYLLTLLFNYLIVDSLILFDEIYEESCPEIKVKNIVINDFIVPAIIFLFCILINYVYLIHSIKYNLIIILWIYLIYKLILLKRKLA